MAIITEIRTDLLYPWIQRIADREGVTITQSGESKHWLFHKNGRTVEVSEDDLMNLAITDQYADLESLVLGCCLKVNG